MTRWSCTGPANTAPPTLEDLKPPWWRYASCRGMGRLMYSTDRVSQAIAVEVCRSCGVREICLSSALVQEASEADLFGVRGGCTPAERRRLLDRAARAG